MRVLNKQNQEVAWSIWTQRKSENSHHCFCSQD